MIGADNRPWYKKKRYLIPLGLIGVASVTSAMGGGTPVPPNAPVAPIEAQQKAYTAPSETTSVQPDTNLSTENYYTNIYGNQVHSPAYSDSVPAGATAQCGDGTYSFSQPHSGTCSHHGGVATWL